jgi:hypothetical protein
MCYSDNPVNSTRMIGTTLPIESTVGNHQSAGLTQQQASGPDHWWKDLSTEECALTGFPLSLLPYPPFHFRMDPNDPDTCQGVDAKYLVLQVMATGEFKACGRDLVESDIAALDQHVRRCNLGRFRLSNFIRLQNNVIQARSVEERASAQNALRSEQEDARKQFRKLQHIQNHRMKDLKKGKAKAAKKKASPKKQKPNQVESQVPRVAQNTPHAVLPQSQAIVLAKPSAPIMNSIPRVIRWADASDDMVGMVIGPNISMSFLDNLQHWRSSTESAKSGKGDELMSRRLENVAWRLFASGADAGVCAPEFLSELDKKSNVPQLHVKPLSAGHSHGRGRDQSHVVKIEEVFADKPAEVLQSWRVSTKEPKVEIVDGQARSRVENQLWRLMALSQRGDPKSLAIVQNACANSPTLRMALGPGTSSSVGSRTHLSHSRMPSDAIRTPSPGSVVSQPVQLQRADSFGAASPASHRTWLRTPSPEFRPWMATSRPMPVLGPRPSGSQGFHQGMQMQATNMPSHGYYMQPVAVPMPQVMSVMPVMALQSGMRAQPVAPSLPTNSALPDNYVCVAVPKHMVQQIQEELSQPGC